MTLTQIIEQLGTLSAQGYTSVSISQMLKELEGTNIGDSQLKLAFEAGVSWVLIDDKPRQAIDIAIEKFIETTK